MKKINIIRGHAKGDVFLSEPILSQLAKKYTVNLTTYHPNIFCSENIFSINKKDDYNLNINLDNSYELNPKQHILTSYINETNKYIDDEIQFRPPEIQFSADEEVLIHQLKNDPFVIINIDSGTNYKNTRNIHGVNIQELAETIQKDHGLKVVEVGLYQDHGLPKVTLSNEREAMVLIAAATLFIGLDSFFLHIAGALNIKSIGFFGAVNPDYRLFPNYPIQVCQKPCEKQHCYHNNVHYGDKSCELELAIAKCTVHETEDIKNKINDMLN